MEPGCEIVAARKLYGGSQNQLGQSFRKMAWHTQFVDADDAGNVAAAINDNTRAVFIESLANPGGVVQDIEAIAKVAHDAGVPLIVDNTMATPMLCRPIDYGADIGSEEHTSELQSLMRISSAVFCLKKKKHKKRILPNH